jgi:hypothetical protein
MRKIPRMALPMGESGGMKAKKPEAYIVVYKQYGQQNHKKSFFLCGKQKLLSS